MSTHLSSDFKVSQEQTLHVSLGNVTQVNKWPKVVDKSKCESKPKSGQPKKRKTCTSRSRQKNVHKGGSTGKPKLQEPDVHVDSSTDDKVSTPKIQVTCKTSVVVMSRPYLVHPKIQITCKTLLVLVAITYSRH